MENDKIEKIKKDLKEIRDMFNHLSSTVNYDKTTEIRNLSISIDELESYLYKITDKENEKE